jgi:hypothetical protein
MEPFAECEGIVVTRHDDGSLVVAELRLGDAGSA